MRTTKAAFLLAWRSSSNAAEAAKKLGISGAGARSRAWKLRKQGQKLKRMPVGRPTTRKTA